MRLVALSAAGWALEAFVFVFIAAALTAADPVRGPLISFAMATLSTLLPGAPGHFGNFEYFGMLGGEAAGVAPELAAGIVLLAHVAIWAPVTSIAALHLLTSGALRRREAGGKRSRSPDNEGTGGA